MDVNAKETTLLRVDCSVDQSPMGGPNSFLLYVALLSSGIKLCHTDRTLG